MGESQPGRKPAGNGLKEAIKGPRPAPRPAKPAIWLAAIWSPRRDPPVDCPAAGNEYADMLSPDKMVGPRNTSGVTILCGEAAPPPAGNPYDGECSTRKRFIKEFYFLLGAVSRSALLGESGVNL